MFAMLCGYLPFDDDEEENEEKEENEENHCDESNHSNNIMRKKSKDNEKEENNEILFQKIIEGVIDFPSHLSDIAIDLMKKILVVDPEKRIQIKDIKKHPFYLLGKNNYLLYQKKISQQKQTKIIKIKNKNQSYNEKENDMSNKIIRGMQKNKNSPSSNSVKNLNHKKKQQNKKILLIVSNKNYRYNIIKNINIKKERNIKNEMEEYERKLFENYLKNVRRNNSIKSKRKKKSEEKSNGNKTIFKALNTINISPANNRFIRNAKLTPKNKNTFSLNQIYIDFNSNKNIFIKDANSMPKKYNYNYIYNLNSLSKINQTIRKSFYFFNKNNNFYHNENNRSLNKGNPTLLTLIPDNLSSKKRNNTEHKLLNDINHYITNENRKKSEESKRQFNFLINQNFNSIEQIFDNLKPKSKKPLLPTIKPNLFNINTINSFNQNNKDSSCFSSLQYLKTEENNNIKNRKRLRYNNGNKNEYHEFNELWNNSNYSVNNKMKYKLCFHNYKGANISNLMGQIN
jgi:hypothetical protein